MLLPYCFGRRGAEIHSPMEGFWGPGGPPPGGYHAWMPRSRVILYSRRTCHLCDQARAVIEAERRRTAFEFEEVFIDGSDELERDFGLRVPVVTVDGVEEFEFAVEAGRLRRLVSA